ncbi:MAG: hypothetical protein KIS66_05865 [Fimbriimonadaceae bacterium]|nr:hypothetical protein [Fimbriimonadaceae bacterium]
MALSRRERVLSLLDPIGEQAETPAAFFLHFPPDCHAGAAAVAKHREFFEFTGMDLVKVQLELPFPRFDPRSPDDWRRAPRFGEEVFGPQVEVVRALVEALGKEALVVVTLYSPFMCAGNLGGRDVLRRHLDEEPTSARAGIEIAAECLMGFVDACVAAGADGFYASTQGAEEGRFASPETFEAHVKPFDLAVMGSFAARCPFSILHVCDYHRSEYGEYRDLGFFEGYPGQMVSAALDMGGRRWTPQEVSDAMGGRPFFGGLDRLGALSRGTEAEARAAARAGLANRSRRFMLGAECTVPGDTPWTNLRAAIDEAHAN